MSHFVMAPFEGGPMDGRLESIETCACHDGMQALLLTEQRDARTAHAYSWDNQRQVYVYEGIQLVPTGQQP